MNARLEAVIGELVAERDGLVKRAQLVDDAIATLEQVIGLTDDGKAEPSSEPAEALPPSPVPGTTRSEKPTPTPKKKVVRRKPTKVKPTGKKPVAKTSLLEDLLATLASYPEQWLTARRTRKRAGLGDDGGYAKKVLVTAAEKGLVKMDVDDAGVARFQHKGADGPPVVKTKPKPKPPAKAKPAPRAPAKKKRAAKKPAAKPTQLPPRPTDSEAEQILSMASDHMMPDQWYTAEGVIRSARTIHGKVPRELVRKVEGTLSRSDGFDMEDDGGRLQFRLQKGFKYVPPGGAE